MSYSRIARFYKLIESVTIGRPLLDARVAHLDRLEAGPSIEQALLVGEGNGSFLLPFAQRFPDTQITVIDESTEMLQVAQARLEATNVNMGRIAFRQADMTAEPLLDGHYDLIVTLFFFDNFDEATVRQLMPVLKSASTPSSQWLLSDFKVPISGWKRLRAQIWLVILYAFFRGATGIPARRLPPTERIFAEANLQPIARATFCGEMLYSILYQR